MEKIDTKYWIKVQKGNSKKLTIASLNRYTKIYSVTISLYMHLLSNQISFFFLFFYWFTFSFPSIVFYRIVHNFSPSYPHVSASLLQFITFLALLCLLLFRNRTHQNTNLNGHAAIANLLRISFSVFFPFFPAFLYAQSKAKPEYLCVSISTEPLYEFRDH